MKRIGMPGGRLKGLVAAALVAALAAPGEARAMFAMPEHVPVDRLVENIEAFVKEHPEDANARYLLGRVHYLAVASKTGTVAVWRRRGLGGGQNGGRELPRVAEDPFQAIEGPPRMLGRPRGRVQPVPPEPVAPTVAELAKHVKAAAENFQRAIEMKPDEGLYHLSLASLLEMTPGEVARELGGWPPGAKPEQATADQLRQAETHIERLGDADAKVRDHATAELERLGPAILPALLRERPDATPEVQARIVGLLKRFWEVAALPEFKAAFELASEKDAQIDNKPLLGLHSIVSYEAASRYLAQTARRDKTPEQTATAEKMAAHIKLLTEKPPGPITPILLSLGGPKPLRELLRPDVRVNFDLDGTARGWGWSWVTADAGLLVWDPAGEGNISSGRQLFGNVTFGLIWRDGYEAMGSLDDNRDGQLSGGELKGLAVWTDRNGDGVSDRGEVTPVEKLGIVSLACRATGREGPEFGAALSNGRGVTLSDGRALPSYDWIATPWQSVPPQPPRKDWEFTKQPPSGRYRTTS